MFANMFSKNGLILKAALKRDSTFIIVWILAIAATLLAGASKFNGIYGNRKAIASIIVTLKTPAMTSIFGVPPTGGNISTGQIFIAMMLVFTGIFTVIPNILLAVRTTRAQEDKGVTEIIRATAVGRLAPFSAAILEIIIFNLILMIISYLSIWAANITGMTSEMISLFSLETVLVGLMFGAAALLAAQIFNSSQAANSASFIFFAICYTVRMVTDVSAVKWTWLSPFGWVELGKIGTQNDLTVVWLMLALTVVFAILTFQIAGHRDLNAALIQSGRGPVTAPRFLSNLNRLSFYLQKYIALIWIFANVATTAMYASIFPQISDLLKINPSIAQIIGSDQVRQVSSQILLQFISMISYFLILLAIIPGIQMIAKINSDTAKGLTELVYAKKTSRGGLLLSYVLPALTTTILADLGAVYTMALIGNALLKHNLPISHFNELALGLMPGILTFLALALFLIAWLPRIVSVLYAYLGLSFFLLYFHNMLKLPNWVLTVTPLGWMRDLPIKNIDWPLWWLQWIIMMILVVISAWGFYRRDLI
ncbi:ABC transporter permease [Oenococcus sp.]|uniref:ABC transporter permease n=1 Tax=Oenococcus sp. TaxID=1979414 RepID=UPI0039ECBBCF